MASVGDTWLPSTPSASFPHPAQAPPPGVPRYKYDSASRRWLRTRGRTAEGRPGARPFAEVTALSGPGIRERGSHRISTGCPPLVSSPASCRYSQEVVPRHPSLLRVRSTGSALCRATARSQGAAWTLLSTPAARRPPGRGPPSRDGAPRTHSCAQGPWGQSVPSPLSFRTPAPGSAAPRGSHSVFRPGGQSCAEPGFVGYRRRGRRHPPSTHGFVLPPPGEAQRG